MRVLEHETSRAIRFFRMEPKSGQGEHGPRLVRAFMDRYEFMQGPQTVEQFNLQNGVLFRGGLFDGHEIEKVQIYDNGILVEGKHDTSILDAFINDAIVWAEKERDVEFHPNPEMPMGSAFFSQLVFEFTPATGAAFEALHEVSREVFQAVAACGLPPAPIAFTGLSIGPDPASGANWGFTFQRRAAEPFANNKFFSAGPLTTIAHVALLDRLERLFNGSSVSPLPS